MTIRMQKDEIDLTSLLVTSRSEKAGARVIFIGDVRDDGIDSLDIEADVNIAESDLTNLATEACDQYHVLSVDIVHRYGRLAVGEIIVVIVVTAGHREEAYAASRSIIEKIKEYVPIWKREVINGKFGNWCH